MTFDDASSRSYCCELNFAPSFWFLQAAGGKRKRRPSAAFRLLTKGEPLFRHARACPEHPQRPDLSMRWQILGTRTRMTAAGEEVCQQYEGGHRPP
ncbi:MAG: hypothetical protein J0H80_12050, partial [Rhizobiales bacterium]|nr:hypothetical protein [Hyphomicrobiales bacterium]